MGIEGLAIEAAASGRRGTAGGKSTMLGMMSSVGALLAACSCCILPLALAAFGMSTGIASSFSALAPLRWPLTIFSVLMVASSWLILLGRRRRAPACMSLGSSGNRSAMAALALATATTFLALSWSLFEPAVMRALL